MAFRLAHASGFAARASCPRKLTIRADQPGRSSLPSNKVETGCALESSRSARELRRPLPEATEKNELRLPRPEDTEKKEVRRPTVAEGVEALKRGWLLAERDATRLAASGLVLTVRRRPTGCVSLIPANALASSSSMGSSRLTSSARWPLRGACSAEASCGT
mmetsp:Transcript_161669/g.286747  ORF Transcript_161669/g.286747 Transcript_161669/m.286747 type:complete len:162 (-) Transcript_161669:26-511(-)